LGSSAAALFVFAVLLEGLLEGLLVELLELVEALALVEEDLLAADLLVELFVPELFVPELERPVDLGFVVERELLEERVLFPAPLPRLEDEVVLVGIDNVRMELVVHTA